MKKFYKTSIFLLLILGSLNSFCTTYTIGLNGLTFAPDSISAIIGDTVVFVLNPFHFPKEVSQASWNNNDSTSNGGFVLPHGGGTLVVTQAKIYYYVCGVHFALGMKGRLFVTNGSGINTPQNIVPSLSFTQNPASENTVIKTNFNLARENNLRVYSFNGTLCLEKSNIAAEEFLNVSGLAPGIYFVELSSENMVLVKKLVVTR